MTSYEKTKLLVKILIGAAWIDGVIQPQERQYLKKVVEKHQLAEEEEIKSLLSGIKAVNPQQCYQWLDEYLGNNPSQEDFQQLLESIGALVYSDDDIHTQEAKLLTYLQQWETNGNNNTSFIQRALSAIRQLYRQAVEGQ